MTPPSGAVRQGWKTLVVQAGVPTAGSAAAATGTKVPASPVLGPGTAADPRLSVHP